MSRLKRPLYHRLLRLSHIKLRTFTTLILFEGSVGLAALLALAEIVNWWGVLIVPATVAVMVKLQDVVARAPTRPLALAQLRTPRPSEHGAVGRSPVPRPSYPTVRMVGDDAVADVNGAAVVGAPASGGNGVVRGVAAVPGRDRGPRATPAGQAAQPRGNQGRFGL